MCVFERERERKGVYVFVCVRGREGVCMCVREREKKVLYYSLTIYRIMSVSQSFFVSVS